jgi:hypothetical protein
MFQWILYSHVMYALRTLKCYGYDASALDDANKIITGATQPFGGVATSLDSPWPLPAQKS